MITERSLKIIYCSKREIVLAKSVAEFVDEPQPSNSSFIDMVASTIDDLKGSKAIMDPTLHGIAFFDHLKESTHRISGPIKRGGVCFTVDAPRRYRL